LWRDTDVPLTLYAGGAPTFWRIFRIIFSDVPVDGPPAGQAAYPLEMHSISIKIEVLFWIFHRSIFAIRQGAEQPAALCRITRKHFRSVVFWFSIICNMCMNDLIA
jgi:hypothetical protein